jgi:hypothetical protein
MFPLRNAQRRLGTGHRPQLPVLETGLLARIEHLPHVAVFARLVRAKNDENLDVSHLASGLRGTFQAVLFMHQVHLDFLWGVERETA